MMSRYWGSRKHLKQGIAAQTSFGGVLAWALIGVDDPKAPKLESQLLGRKPAVWQGDSES